MEESHHLKYFKVENFKCFESFEMADIGQFNLIVGDNNVGKTSVLEALLFDERNNVQMLNNLWGALAFRKIFFNPLLNIGYTDLYFRNQNKKQIDYYFNFENEENKFLKCQSLNLDQLSAVELKSIETKILTNRNVKSLIKFDSNEYSNFEFASFGTAKEKYKEYAPIISSGIGYQDDLTSIFSNSIQKSTSLLENLTNEIKSWIPNLKNIEIINNIIFEDPSKIVFRYEDQDSVILLAQQGEGTTKLFRILIELKVTEGNRLMIDEIDNGIHYSRFKQYWKIILKSAMRNKVQLFMTTHSQECLKYFEEALLDLGSEYQNLSRHFLLKKDKEGKVFAKKFSFDQFKHALEEGNEIRD
jgi:AAA15 family ATPase/GTPase